MDFIFNHLSNLLQGFIYIQSGVSEPGNFLQNFQVNAIFRHRMSLCVELSFRSGEFYSKDLNTV